MAPRYRLITPAFIAPYYLKEGTEITFDGPYGPHMEPLNAEAEARAEAYYNAHPEMKISPSPVEQLPLTFEIHETKAPSGPPSVDLTTLAEVPLARAKPGPTEAGYSPRR